MRRSVRQRRLFPHARLGAADPTARQVVARCARTLAALGPPGAGRDLRAEAFVGATGPR